MLFLSNDEMKPYGFIYKTTLPDGRYYIGQHKICNPATLDPLYFGSGVIIKDYMKAKGTSSLKREILSYGFSHDEMNILEIQHITEEVLGDPKNINLDFGGRNKFRCSTVKNQIGKSISRLRREQPWRWTKRVGERNANSSHWKLVSPAGVTYEILGPIDDFCHSHGLSPHTLRVACRQGWIPRRGKCADWKIFNLIIGAGTIRETQNHGEARSGDNNPSRKKKLKALEQVLE
jgi:hypothetical protein